MSHKVAECNTVQYKVSHKVAQCNTQSNTKCPTRWHSYHFLPASLREKPNPTKLIAPTHSLYPNAYRLLFKLPIQTLMPIVFQFSNRDITVMVRKLTMVTECKTKLMDEEEGAGQKNKKKS